MWIMLSNSFLSIVSIPGDDANLSVRARIKGDIEAVFPGSKVIKTPKADYRFRAVVAREHVADVIAANVEEIDYPNFKNSVRANDRHDAYLQCWTAMLRFQTLRETPKRKRSKLNAVYP